MAAKTDKEIKAMIASMEKLRPKVRPFSMFGDDNLKSFDATVDTLREHRDDDDIAVLMDIDYDLWSRCDSTIKWMAGDEDKEAPDHGWPLSK